MKLVFVLILRIIIVGGLKLTNCPQKDIKFEKILGVRPPLETGALLYRKENGAVTLECLQKCKQDPNCRSFVLHFNSSTCYWYREEAEGGQELDQVFDNEVAWFVKMCLNAKSCDKLWYFERIPGAILVGNNTKALPNKLTRNECEQYCLNENEFNCRSAKFQIKDSNYGPNADTKGLCTLSDSDRHLLPNSYRVSNYHEEYLENQCQNNKEIASNAFCGYEEYTGVIFSHIDIIYQSKTKEECEELCDHFLEFNCRGFSLIPQNQNLFICHLHSEDSKVHGPRLLLETANGSFYEKPRCINVSITCTEEYLTVLYQPEVKFMGRIYMQGYSDHEDCYAKGEGWNSLQLKLPLKSSQCGIIEAQSIDNRTLLSGTMVLQYNGFIQTQGDRLIRIGCIFTTNDSKLLVGTGVNVVTDAPNTGSILLNTTNSIDKKPSVQMRIVDLATQTEATDTQIGQELQLIIEQKEPDANLDMWAGHLIAMTENGADSIFLLDDQGCPTNLNIFPALIKIRNENTTRLVGNFQAFKFSTSSIVRFSVIVQFCPQTCPPVDCADQRAYGRYKRAEIETHNGIQIVNVTNKKVEKKSEKAETSLEFIMTVQDPKISSDRLENVGPKIVIAGYNYETKEVCLDYSLFLGIIIGWTIIQIIFLIACYFMVRRYKKIYQTEYESASTLNDEYNKNFNFGYNNYDQRRVHWADNGEHMQ